MTIESLLQTCAELGIKLALKGDASDRLQVDAPKGALTASLREDLVAHKTELIAFLKSQNVSHPTQAQDPDETVTRNPASSLLKSPETPSLNLEPSRVVPPAHFDRAGVELNKLLSGNDYDVSVIESTEPATRQIISGQLLTALAGRDPDERGRAKHAFLGHGYFNEAIAQLLSADSPAERAAAARKLGVVCDAGATAPPHT